MNVKVKICGIRSVESALVTVEVGADFVGLNFVQSSKRYVDLEMAKRIVFKIKGKTQIVGVFQNEKVEQVNFIANLLDLDLVQLHGKEDKIYMSQINRPIIKRIYNENDIVGLLPDFVLVDRVVQGRGDMVDFTKAKKIAEQCQIFFAGGLTPDSVAMVIKKVKPFAVDVAGGIETDGKEDFQKIRQFINEAKGVQI